MRFKRYFVLCIPCSYKKNNTFSNSSGYACIMNTHDSGLNNPDFCALPRLTLFFCLKCLGWNCGCTYENIHKVKSFKVPGFRGRVFPRQKIAWTCAMAQWREGLKNYLSIKWLKICCDVFSRTHLCGFLRIILKIDILNAVNALFQKFLWSKKLEKTNFFIEYYWVHYCEGNYNICYHILH